MIIEIDNNAGFCFGVVKAIDTAEAELSHGGSLYCLGDIVHNNAEVKRLHDKGLEIIDYEQFEQLSDVRVLIRAHGEPPSTYTTAKQRNIQLIDATCPIVLALQKRVRQGYEEMCAVNGQVVIFGKPGHAEVIGLCGQTDNTAIVVSHPDDIAQVDMNRPIRLYSQTTKSKEEYAQLISNLEHVNDFVAYDTICNRVANRAKELEGFAERVELLLFVSGANSSNGHYLYEYCRKVQPNTYLISQASDIEPSWLKGVQRVGITGATSTPRWLMEQIANTLRLSHNRLKNLQLTNFKNYAQLDVNLCPNVNCFVGNNGVGKTNLLDAVYYLSFCKSYFNPIDSQNVRQGSDYFAIHGRYEMGESMGDSNDLVQVSCVQKYGVAKQMKWNKKAYKSFAEHIGKIPLVMVSPNDQVLILGGSEVRRKFVDGVISQANKGYLSHLLQYQKALEQRNKLLKQFYEDRQWDEDSLSIWDDQLVRHGEVLYAERRNFLKEFGPLFDSYYQWISNSNEHAALQYETQVVENGQFADTLKDARKADKYAQYTTVGPHKDDIDLKIGDFSVKKFGSQGQQKTFVLALKLAQFEYILNRCGIKPILLLDDIFDKLDMVRVKQLVHLVGSDRFGQVFLTDTQPGRVEGIFEEIPEVEHRIFVVSKDANGESKVEVSESIS